MLILYVVCIISPLSTILHSLYYINLLASISVHTYSLLINTQIKTYIYTDTDRKHEDIVTNTLTYAN